MRPTILIILLALATAASTAAQKAEGKAASPPAEPVTISAPALKAATALAQNASAELRKWVEDYARKELTGEKLELQETFDAMPALFPGHSAAVREAVLYLILYSAYRREEEMHQKYAHALAENGRDLKKVEDQLRFWADHYRFPPEGTQARRDRDAQVLPLLAVRENLLNRRRLAATVEINSRRRADFFLGFLNRMAESLESSPAEILDTISPPAERGNEKK